MKSCADVEPLITPYLDGVAASEERLEIELHLDACPLCRELVHAQRVARTVVRARAASLCEAASPALRTRCGAAKAGAGPWRSTERSSRTIRRWLPLSMGAAVVSGIVALMLTSLTTRLETSLAAQLTLEHLKCFVLAEPAPSNTTPQQIEADLSKNYGWDIRVPGSLPAEGLELLGARRCLYSDGQMAHVMYRSEGRPVSVFVMFNARHADRVFEIMGHEAIVWSHDGKTYAVVGREPVPELQRVAAYVRRVSY